MDFQLVEQRLGHHRQTLKVLMRNIKKNAVSE
jgi:stearoyl-CoA desaturase (delta-9 desaturase)